MIEELFGPIEASPRAINWLSRKHLIFEVRNKANLQTEVFIYPKELTAALREIEKEIKKPNNFGAKSAVELATIAAKADPEFNFDAFIRAMPSAAATKPFREARALLNLTASELQALIDLKPGKALSERLEEALARVR